MFIRGPRPGEGPSPWWTFARPLRAGELGDRRGGGKLARHSKEFPPACCGRRDRDTANVPQDRLKLFPSAANYFRAECSDGSLVPLSHPAASHEGWMVGNNKLRLEFATEVQHRAWGKTVDRYSEVQGATCARP